MTTTTSAPPQQISAAALDELSAARRDPAWLIAMRRRAWDQYAQLPDVDPRDDAWRWVPPPYRKVNSLPAARVPVEIVGAPSQSGVLVAELSGAPNDRAAELIQAHAFQRALPPSSGKFQALHAAWVNGVVLIYVPRNTDVAAPITVRWQWDGERVVCPHVLVIAEEGSRVSVIEEHLSAPEARVQGLTGVEILAGRGSQVSYTSWQGCGPKVTQLGFQRFLLSRDAHVQSVLLSTGGHVTRHEIEAVAEEPGANCDLLGFRMGNTNQQCHVVTLQDHRASNTTSDLIFKSALHDSAQATYFGTIRIHKDAQKCNAYQQDRTILLGEHAKANSTPVLEIEADDVRCTHGASVGPIDEDQLFYLAARGIPPEIASTMLVYGFFEEALDRLKVPQLRTFCAERLAAAVGALEYTQATY